MDSNWAVAVRFNVGVEVGVLVGLGGLGVLVAVGGTGVAVGGVRLATIAVWAITVAATATGSSDGWQALITT
jgi:hypothetical protein